MRNITEIIIHCTATPEGRKHTLTDIDQWHRQKGWKGIGYHYVVYLDGSVHTGRPVEQTGAHCQGHNRNSIAIAYIGGCDKNMQPKDTRTAAQKAALAKLVKSLTDRYPSATVHGHNEFADKTCPCFDVQAWRKEIRL